MCVALLLFGNLSPQYNTHLSGLHHLLWLCVLLLKQKTASWPFLYINKLFKRSQILNWCMYSKTSFVDRCVNKACPTQCKTTPTPCLPVHSPHFIWLCFSHKYSKKVHFFHNLVDKIGTLTVKEIKHRTFSNS